MSLLDAAAPLSGGTPVAAGGNRPLRLNAERVWMVRTGRVDVFATRLADGEPDGPRRHLFRLEAGDPVFGAGEDPGCGRALLAVGGPGTTLAEFTLAQVQALAADPGTQPVFIDLVHRWTERVWEGLVGRATVRRATGGAPGEEIILPHGFSLRPDAPVVW
ncbi:MAG: hypothetical protein KY467_15050, partial [Gemmatimonadetes bacterium]|nr:hypothetical protein [Gemmatimonadota bacterium]